MARIRTIKPDFWTDEKIVELSPLARLLFIGLWNFADDSGRLEYSPRSIGMKILPADAVDYSELLGELRGSSLITVYAVEGKEYLQVNGFEKHQKIDKRSPSKLPPPPRPAEFPRIVPTEGEGNGRGKGSSVPDGTDAPSGAPAKGDLLEVPLALYRPPGEDWSKALFGPGLAWLAKCTGKPPDRCRSLLGKFLQWSGQEHREVFRLLAECERDGVADPAAYVAKSLQPGDSVASILARV